MGFITDKQTMDDLNILGRYKNNSIFRVFNNTITSGGGRLLENMFQHPLTNIADINARKEKFSFFEKLQVALPFNSKEIEIVEYYFRNPASKNKLTATTNLTKIKLMNYVFYDKEYTTIRDGLEKTIQVFSKLKVVLKRIEQESKNTFYHAQAKKMTNLLNHKSLELAWQCVGVHPLSLKQLLNLDFIFRGVLYNEFIDLLNELYKMDVYISVSDVSRKRKFVYAKAVKKEEKYIDIKQGYHPCIPEAIANDIYIGKDKHVFFLTGANMAGKSTLMKSFGVIVYLAHMGFPVAAKQMTFSLHEGIYTSINVPDNIDKGYSHFYAEVVRVKHVAQQVATNKQLVIIFDELFKGTNVKDASDGTIAIVDAFSKRNGAFIISTHIMEAGITLGENNDRLFFRYLPTIVKNNVPTYPYVLEDGITDDRQGMMIIQNERIIETINGGS
ncbi:hypothetical protein LPB03_12090 [Polaribacter vadi]|uniref:DNA mismatch repair proteins mutS family domain-containing protein n=1 Tax=Polaribacter vadi TaxID=1774273 RepID=A0A1B8TT01_9FLAO|nr:hypothetical protein [Polaribacter vadi]AOW18147.1 hypothetical protein LPB03_12090 [Polaribacter vadi]OBY62876.1 hypothetical protein LPB3_12105 [Polaribacter vadi]